MFDGIPYSRTFSSVTTPPPSFNFDRNIYFLCPIKYSIFSLGLFSPIVN